MITTTDVQDYSRTACSLWEKTGNQIQLQTRSANFNIVSLGTCTVTFTRYKKLFQWHYTPRLTSSAEKYTTDFVVKRVKWTLLQALRFCTGRTAHRGSRGIALIFLDHGTRRWGVSVTPRPLFTPGKEPVPIVQEAGNAPGAEISPPPEFNYRTAQPVAILCTDYAIPAHDTFRLPGKCKSNGHRRNKHDPKTQKTHHVIKAHRERLKTLAVN